VNAWADWRAAVRDFERPRLWLAVWLFGWLLCVVLSLGHPPQIGLEVPEGDKVEHFLAYGLLSVWAVWLFATRRAHWQAALALVLLGVAMEFAQGAFTSDRMMDPRDALADALGVGVGQLLALGRGQLLLLRWDRRLFGR
jgi:VanZ family protein